MDKEVDERLQDLNFDDTKMPTSVLHGRKVSTFLGIFRDDENLNTNDLSNDNLFNENQLITKNKNVNKLTQNTTNENDVLSSMIRQSKSNKGLKFDNNVKTIGNDDYEDDRTSDNIDIINKIYESSNDNTNDILDEDNDLNLQPVSSATYYPHKSKSTTKFIDSIFSDDSNETNTPRLSPTDQISNIDGAVSNLLLNNNIMSDVDNDLVIQNDKADNKISSKEQKIDNYNKNSINIINNNITIDKNDSSSTATTTTTTATATTSEINNSTDNSSVPPIKHEKLIKNNNNNFHDATLLDNNNNDSTSQQRIDKNDNDDGNIADDEIEFDNDENLNEDEEDEKEYPLAVELTPFTNKVGGHTAIFRFSKRAVCKTLVKRENKWYETMEITNNNLLKFMPRYIGVLNVRQHFNSRKDFLNQVSNQSKDKSNHDNENIDNDENIENDSTKLIASQSIVSEFVENDNQIGAPLEHIHSFPSSQPIPIKFNKRHSHHDHLLPEVVINDNRHIIPDSLWGRYSYSNSASPSSVPNESFLSRSFYDDENDEIEDSTYNLHQMSDSNRRRDSGSTMLNTKLKDLVIQEVFAPIYSRKNSANQSYINSPTETPTRTISGKYLRKNKRSSSSSSQNAKKNMNFTRIRRDSNISLDEINNNSANFDKQSSLLQKSKQELLSNVPHSVMDLKQFQQKAIIRENLITGYNNNNNNNGDCNYASYNKSGSNSSNKIDDTILNATKNISNTDKKESPNSENNSATPNVLESITFEDHTDTIVSKFILLEDLTRSLIKPCALDLKMGTRQYGVDATKTKQKSQRNKCLKTTSRKLGVRICGLKIWNSSYYIKRDKYFGRRVKTGWQFARTLARFLYDGKTIASIVRHIPRLVKQLDLLALEVANLKGFRLYGASLLLMYDGQNDKKCKIKVNLIDFAKCVTHDDLIYGLEHDTFKIPPRNGANMEDLGFIHGVKSVRFYLMTIWNYLTVDEPLLYHEEELQNLFFNCIELKGKELFDKSWDWLDEFDKEDESTFNDPEHELRKKWRRYELIFDVEPHYNDESDVSD